MHIKPIYVNEICKPRQRIVGKYCRGTKGTDLVTSGITVTKLAKDKQVRTMLFRCQAEFVHR